MTLTHKIAGTSAAAPRVTRDDALKFLGTGRTSASLLALAASPQAVAGIAEQSGRTRRDARDLILSFSAAVGELEAEGLRAPDCWDLLGWSPEFVAEVLGLPLDGAR